MTFRGYGFLFCIILAIGLAAIMPEVASSGNPLGAAFLPIAGIAVIFFNLGLTLQTDRLAEDLKDWRLHIFCQSGIFLVIPLVTLLAVHLTGPLFTETTRLGIIYLAVLPTTISTAIVFTMNAGGNTSAAIFNCSVANLSALLITPLWMGWQLSVAGNAAMPFGATFLKIATLILLPLVIGQVCRCFLPKINKSGKKNITFINNAIILFLIYRSFCESFAGSAWSNQPVTSTLVLIVFTLGLLLLNSGYAWFAGGCIFANRENRITAFYCTSQKSLAAGVGLMTPIFEFPNNTIDPAAILLPLLLYHSLQLALGGWLQTRILKEAKTDAVPTCIG